MRAKKKVDLELVLIERYREYSRKYYRRHKERISAAAKKRYAIPEVKAMRRAKAIEYYRRPGGRVAVIEYNKRPEVIERRRRYQREYYKRKKEESNRKQAP